MKTISIYLLFSLAAFIGIGYIYGERPFAGSDQDLFDAVIYGDIQSAGNLIDKGNDPNFVTINRENLLHTIASLGDLQTNQTEDTKALIKTLLDKGLDIEKRNYHGDTPLLKSVAHEIPADLIDFLLDNGARADVTNNWRDTPLTVALNKQNIPVALKLLSYGANPNTKFKYKKDDEYTTETTPLIIAVTLASPELVQALIDKDANSDEENSIGTTPLLLATRTLKYAQRSGNKVLEDKLNAIIKILKSPKKEEL